MRKFTRLFLIVMLMALPALSTFGQTVNSLWVDGRVYFKIADNAVLNVADDDGKVNPKDVYFLDGLIEKYGITELVMPFKSASSDILQRTFKMDFSEKNDIKELLSELNSNPAIEYAEPAPLFFISLTPNDTYYNSDLDGGFLFGSANSSWHLNLINASQAWDVTTGNPNIVVAVLDNAIWINHPDLMNKVVLSVDLGNGDDDPNPPTPATYIWSHGTHSAGLIAAETNNGIGVSSIGNGISLMAIKLGDDASDGQSMAAGFEGIVWAADHGADVISMSWGSPQFFQTMQNIVNYAYNKGCVLVGAAGNNGNGAETQANPDIPVNYVGYPAALEHVIAVGSCDVGDNKSDFSNYGTWIDVLAPGGYAAEGGLLGNMFFSVLSTTASEAGDVSSMMDGSGGGAASFGISGNYDCMQGTSMACPVTSGLCGLILSANPDLTPEELTAILKSTCDNVDSENADFIDSIGSGRINAFAAVTAAMAANASLVADFEASTVVIDEGGSVDFTDLTTGTPTSWSWEFEGGMPATSTDQNPSGITYSTAGVYSVTLTAGDGIDTDTEVKTYFILVGQSGSVAESGWIEQNTHFTSPYRGVITTNVVDENTAWVLTYDGSGGGSITRDFARTTDAGATWIPDTIEIATNYAPGDISAVDGLNAWVAVYDANGGGGIYRTSDGGANWTQQTTAAFSNAASFTNVIHMFDANNGYCMGDPINSEFEIYTTTDGGENWILLDGANIPAPESGEMGWTGVADAVGDVAWFGTNKGRIYKTTDRGLTWNVYETGEANVSRISFADALNGVAICQVANSTTGVIESWKMVKTEDGGQTWTQIAVTDQYLSDVSAVPGRPGMYVGTKISQTLGENFSAYSLDSGTSWTQIDDSVQYTNVVMFNEDCGWAGGFNMDANNGGIYKWVGLAPTDAPYFLSSPSLQVVEFDTYTYNVSTEDPNSLSLTITATEKPAWLTLTDNGDGTATLSGTAPEIPGQSEGYQVILNVSNGTYDADQTFTIVVLTSNTAPEFTSEPILTHVQYIPFTYNVTTTDAEGDDLTITATTLPSWASFVDNGDGTATVTGIPLTTSSIGFQIVLRVSDGMFEDVQDFRVKVSANSAPEFTSTPVTTHVQNTVYTYNVTATDAEGEVLVISATTLPAWLNLTDNGDGTATLTGTPSDISSPGDQVVLTVSDGHNSDTQDFLIEVTPAGIEDFGYGIIGVYPNPTKGFIQVSNCQGATYEILDVTGRLLSVGGIKESVEGLNLNDLSDGNFIIRLYNNEKVVTVKIVKF